MRVRDSSSFWFCTFELGIYIGLKDGVDVFPDMRIATILLPENVDTNKVDYDARRISKY